MSGVLVNNSGADPVRFGLGRAQRLKHRGEFGRIREQGQRVSKGCLIANWRTLPAGAVSRVGVVTSRKLGRAHVRSRARRLLREAFRLHQHELSVPLEIVLIARASITGRKLCEVERDYLAILGKAGLLRSEA